jgi:hypothetical protein
MFVLAVGDPFNGMTLRGPFATVEDAQEEADNSWIRRHSWEIVEVLPL